MIRLYKVLGYALTDITEGDERLSRPINELFAYLDENEEESKKLFWDGMNRERERRVIYETQFWTDEQRDSLDLLRMMNTGDESNSVVVFIPASKVKEWRRSDDDIDYYELKAEHGAGEGILDMASCPVGLKTFSAPIYHYSSYVDRRDPDNFETAGKLSELIRLLGGMDAVKNSKVSLEALHYTKEEFTQYVRPQVPLCVRNFCEVFNVFRDPEMVWDLKPAVNVYWG